MSDNTAHRFRLFIQGIPFSDLSTHASSITFFFFLSLIPFLILAFALFPFTGISEAQVTEAIDQYVPSAAETIVSGIVHQAYSAGIPVYSISILFMIWSSSQFMNALARGLNAVGHAHRRHRRLIRILLNILDTLLLAALLFCLLFMRGIKNDLLRSMEELLADIPFIHRLASLTNIVTVFITAILILALIYTIVPDDRRNYRKQIPGALCAAIGWIIFSLLFRIYINGVNIYNSFFGSLAAGAIFLFWLYCCFMILLVGAHINLHHAQKE